MDALLVYPDLCAHKICIADGLPDPYRDPRTRTGATVSPRGIESPSLYCVDIALGHLHRCLQGARFSGSGLFLDSVRMLSRGWISSHVLYHGGGYRLTVEYHTTVSLPDGCTGVTVSRPTAVALPISHRGRLERKSRRKRGILLTVHGGTKPSQLETTTCYIAVWNKSEVSDISSINTSPKYNRIVQL